PQGSETPPTVPAEKNDEVVLSPMLGTIEGLTEVQQAELYACEQVIGSGWHTFVQVGLALARIRDGELYTTEYDSFEAYYRVKWQYGQHYVNRLISAAQVFTPLVTICHQTKPEYESQVRPLVGLTLACRNLA